MDKSYQELPQPVKSILNQDHSRTITTPDRRRSGFSTTIEMSFGWLYSTPRRKLATRKRLVVVQQRSQLDLLRYLQIEESQCYRPTVFDRVGTRVGWIARWFFAQVMSAKVRHQVLPKGEVWRIDKADLKIFRVVVLLS